MEGAAVAVVVVWMMRLENSPIGQRCYSSTYTLLSGKELFGVGNIELHLLCVPIYENG